MKSLKAWETVELEKVSEAKVAGMNDERVRVVGRIWEARSNVEQVVNHVHQMAAMLEELAKDIRQHVDDENIKYYDDYGTGNTWVRVAGRVQHDVLWRLANLGLDNLTTEAERADSCDRLAEELIT